jgi:hypothetical protein
MLLPNLILLIDVTFSTPTDGMRRPVSDGMLYAPKVSTCSKAQIKQRRRAMKKVSTAATTQSRNIPQQRLTIGLDLGDRNSW